MSVLWNTLQRFFERYGNQPTYWIAYSGGLDSHVLLSLASLFRDRYALSLKAVHVDHSLHRASPLWALHCRSVCERLKIDFETIKIKIDAEGESLEAAARDARYAALASYLKEGDMLLTAHHQQDQAETVLLQLLRGAGPKGLSGMPSCKPFGGGFHARPLLKLTRDQLRQYADTEALQWIQDESNQNTQFSRNYIRHEVIPLLLKRSPSLIQILARSAGHCAESQALLEEFSLTALKNIAGLQKDTLSVKQLMSLNPAAQRLMLRTWIHSLGFPLPDTKKIETLKRCVLLAKPDRTPSVAWRGAVIRRYRDDLYVMPHDTVEPTISQVAWDLTAPLALPGIGTLSAVLTKGGGIKCELDGVTVRFRRGGETLRLKGRGSHTLKNLFQEWRVPTWERGRLPLLFTGDQCIGVVGYAMDANYMAPQHEMGYEPHLERSVWPVIK